MAKSKHNNEDVKLEAELGTQHEAPKEAEFKRYRKNEYAEIRPYVEGEDMTGINVGDVDAKNGSPCKGDMIARNPNNPEDRWLIPKEDFLNNYGE